MEKYVSNDGKNCSRCNKEISNTPVDYGVLHRIDNYLVYFCLDCDSLYNSRVNSLLIDFSKGW